MNPFTSVDLRRENLVSTVTANATRVAELGQWPARVNAQESLISRIPQVDETGPGFDAGLACCLDLIPRDKQTLAATLHAAYTEDAVQQVRRELALPDDQFGETETCWWLLGCCSCSEGGVSFQQFKDQLIGFNSLAQSDVSTRVKFAGEEFALMCDKYRVTSDGTVFVVTDGGIQGAYVDGYDWGVQWTESYGIFFVSTFRPTLGLEDFTWSDHVDDLGRPMSGPVHGSKQYVKCATLDELTRVTAIVRDTLG